VGTLNKEEELHLSNLPNPETRSVGTFFWSLDCLRITSNQLELFDMGIGRKDNNLTKSFRFLLQTHFTVKFLKKS
jgi:hypothetical protein